ncbi:hypothetical protein Adt_44656 [Abeliophyllum distichum]|uniref:Uncharacterized protein n=1 Tax=Abeliophyllum distichum TaxID=126358 RepID=A0ABD1PBG9_9LAMI
MKELLSSEDTDFGLEQPAPIPKHTENDNAKEIDPSCVASQRTFQKRALDIPNDGGPKRLKFSFPSTRNILSSERVENIPGTILVSEDSNSGDQASRGLEATLVLEDSSSEDQVNSGTSAVKIPENEQEAHVTPSSLSLIVVPTSNINNRRIAPICSSMSGLPFGITEGSSLIKDIFREAMTKYLKKSFTDVIKHDFSNLRTWWAKSNQRLQNLITKSFQEDPGPLTRRMEVFLKRVDAYLFKRKQILECPTLEERDQQLESLNNRIDVKMAIFSSLESKTSQLASELDKLRDEL